MKCKLKLTPCECSNLALIHKHNTLHYYINDEEVSNISKNVTPMRLHAVENTESLIEGDHVIWKDSIFEINSNEAYSNTKFITLEYAKAYTQNKVIATTDKSLELLEIPNIFILYYAQEYNKGNVIEEIEFEKIEDDVKVIIP